MTGCAEQSISLARPPWLRVKAPVGSGHQELHKLLMSERLHTVCSSAACPNMGECWNNGTATFMILGNQCTRSCRFCNVQSKRRPDPVDLDEPARLLKSALVMKLRHIVITSVARDDLSDGGASQFARCLKLIHEHAPNLSTEVLVPDFFGEMSNLKIVVDESPTIFNHNIETVERLTKKIRSGARYERSLKLLADAKSLKPELRTKSGIMLGLGENDSEVRQALKDLRSHHCDQVTIGQYLRPSPWHHPVERYVSPADFFDLGVFARSLGFSHVESGPLVRSSYHAERGAL
jgi:lipoic acid synthetase